MPGGRWAPGRDGAVDSGVMTGSGKREQKGKRWANGGRFSDGS